MRRWSMYSTAVVVTALLVLPRDGVAQRTPLTVRRGDLERALGRQLEKVPFAVRELSGAATPAVGDSLIVQVGDFVETAFDDSATAVMEGDNARVTLPIRFVSFDSDMRATRALRPQILVEGGGLRLDRRTGTFRGAMRIWLDDSLTPGTQSIDPPVVLYVAGMVDRVEPDSISIAATDVTSRITVETAPPQEPLVALEIASGARAEGKKFTVPVLMSKLDLRPGRVRLPGFGLGSVPLAIRVPVEAGEEPIEVSLSSNRGELDPLVLSIEPGTTGMATLRSGGVGRDTVRAAAIALEDGVLELRYGWPISFVVAGLVGATLGGVFASRRSRRRKGDLVVSVAGGVIAVVAYTLGLNLTGVALNVGYSEAAVFLVAAVGSIVGLPALGKMFGSVSPSPPAENG